MLRSTAQECGEAFSHFIHLLWDLSSGVPGFIPVDTQPTRPEFYLRPASKTLLKPSGVFGRFLECSGPYLTVLVQVSADVMLGIKLRA